MPGAQKTVRISISASSAGAAVHQSGPVIVEFGDQQPLCRCVDAVMAAVGRALGELRARERESLKSARKHLVSRVL